MDPVILQLLDKWSEMVKKTEQKSVLSPFTTNSHDINDIGAALAKAQGEMPVIPKDSNAGTGSYKYSYASLATIKKISTPVLAKHALAVSQHLVSKDDDVYIETKLIHSSGQWLRSFVRADPDKEGIHGLGSAITYMKRYAYCSLVGIVADEDDDATATPVTAQKSFVTPKPTYNKPSLPF